MGLFQKPGLQISNEAVSYTMSNKKIICSHCNNETFFQLPNILLNTPGITFFGLDWANKTASVLVCSNCSKLEWFLNSPSEMK
jgi:hypothetical protein